VRLAPVASAVVHQGGRDAPPLHRSTIFSEKSRKTMPAR
jgi:hypothetical protein